MSDRKILILWNQPEADVYELWRADGMSASVTTVQEELDAIADAVRANGHAAVGVNLKDDFHALVAAIEQHHPDAIFNLVDFFGDDLAYESHIAGVYELLGIAYTGSRPAALMTCQRKHRAKALFAQAGIPTAPYVVVDPRDRVIAEHELHFPLIVKPAMEDASGGIDLDAVVYDQAALEARVAKVLDEHEMPVLVEEYIDGRELHCAILGGVALPLFEMVFSERVGPDGRVLPKIVTFRAKWDPNSRDFLDVDGVCPPEDLEPEIAVAIQEVALRAAKVVGVRDYARVDMRVDPATGDAFVLEVNPNPDLADGGAFMQCAMASGRTFDGTIGEIVDMALARAERPRVLPQGDELLREYLARS